MKTNSDLLLNSLHSTNLCLIFAASSHYMAFPVFEMQTCVYNALYAADVSNPIDCARRVNALHTPVGCRCLP